MNTLLIFFALPVATIIISAILQRILKCPITVAAFVFAVFLIVAFAAFDETFLVAVIVYTLIAFITAAIVKFLCEGRNNNNNLCDILTNIVGNTNLSNVLPEAENNDDNLNNSQSNNCGCGCTRHRYRRF